MSISEDDVKPFNEDDFRDYCIRIIDKAIKDREAFDELVDRWYNDWRDVKKTKLLPWIGCANWSVPITSTSVDDIIPRINEAIFGLNPPMDVRPLNQTSAQYRDVIKAFMNWDIKTHPELMKEVWFFIQNTVWGGTGFVKNFFKKERRVASKKPVPAYLISGEPVMSPDGTPIEVTEDNTAMLTEQGIKFTEGEVLEKRRSWKTYDPKTEAVDIKDCIFPVDSTSIEDAWDNSLIAIRVRKTKDFLRRQLKEDDKELYKKLDRVKIKGLDSKLEKTEDERERKQLREYATKTSKIECFEVYVNYDLDGDGFEEKVVALIGWESKMLFGYEEYPYDHERCPIVPGYIKPVHNQPFGMGVPEMLYDTKGEIDAIHNSRTDRAKLYNDPIMTHTETSGFNRKAHKRGPGRTWRLADRSESAIGYMQPPAKNDASSHAEEELALAYAQKRSKVTDYALGSESGIAANSTATGIQALIAEGKVGFRSFTTWMALSIAEIFEQRLALYQQFWGKATDPEITEWVREILDVPDNPLAGQSIDAIRHKFNIVMTATSEDAKMALSRAQAAYEIIGNEPMFESAPNKKRDIIVDLLRSTGMQDPEEKVPTQEEIMQYQVEIQKQAIMQMQQEQADAQARGEGQISQ